MSKMVNCKSCQNELAKGVNKCPKCGKDQRNFFGKHKILTGLGVVILLIIIGNMDGNSATTTPIVDSNITTTTAQPTTPTPVETVKTPEPAKSTVPTEYISALAKAELYGTTMDMSKKGIYDQLTSEHGEKFSKESAQYAVDNVKIDYNANALKKAEMYQKEMSMSPSAVYDQLVSEHGEKFTQAEAQYARDNLK
ncbi:Ltp family lipoprotein [Clostridium tagluense]|uniref:Ltp family lipoprotein n=1 Tax=Clostridium tagluense TaxID=360422 RepID=UPI001CF5DBB0|nr:Ltp family lipoprotein [Clostridium tagluense]MCB2299616.1 Ltp family lipoprotein [Clostridium tagluense]MCB2311645.1 Ltp family lipoprotein [Clostridium tagluense]MCB2316369.1 Ltp family lipoprotein [Clostridium tagluense]MCB2321246.1 Ltp family lipoprotein [Clostridium tagluense]MCB2326238.1 Ltp family lipoprotein [Clostridium tagluense]